MPGPLTPATIIVEHALMASKLQKRLDMALSYHGLSFTEYLILYHLLNAPQHTLSRIALAEQIGITASGVTRLLSPMEKIGLTQKQINPRDARQSLVQLTPTGKTLFVDASVGFDHCAAKLLDKLNEDEQQTLAALVTKLV